jgi:hypothetical protein
VSENFSRHKNYRDEELAEAGTHRASGSIKEKLVNTALLIGSIIFSLLALEVGLRSYHGEWGYTNFRHPPPTASFGYPPAYDAELGWVPKQDVQPNKNFWGGWETVTILQDGIRSNGRGEVWDGSGDPILAVGDSMTFGDEVSDWETWPAHLEKLSGRRVINGGVFAYGIDQAFLRARRLLNRYRFSTVIFSFIQEDVRRCRWSQWGSTGKPYFDFKDGRLTLENVPVPPPSPPPKESELIIALEHSRLVHAIMKRLYGEWWLEGSIPRLDEKKVVQVACAVLHELEGLSKSRGSELIVLVQYHKHEISSKSTAVKGVVESVLSCLSDPATRVLDLKPALSEVKVEDLSRYYGPFLPPQHWSHMTAEGNQFVALEISKSLPQR